jgi:hypothetical protein
MLNSGKLDAALRYVDENDSDCLLANLQGQTTIASLSIALPDSLLPILPILDTSVIKRTGNVWGVCSIAAVN